MNAITSDPTTTETEDRLAILELIGNLALLLDARDWDALEGLWADQVHYDAPHCSAASPRP